VQACKEGLATCNSKTVAKEQKMQDAKFCANYLEKKRSANRLGLEVTEKTNWTA